MATRILLIVFILLCFPFLVFGNTTLILDTNVKEEKRTDFLVDLVTFNVNTNGWINILCVGSLPDPFYSAVRSLNFTFSVLDTRGNAENMNHVVPYDANMIIMHCTDFEDFEKALIMSMASPYWHPLSRLILYYDIKDQEDIPKIFMILWFYKSCNAIIVQYDDEEETMSLSHYSTYITESYRLTYEFGCWKSIKLGRPVRKFRDSFICVKGCQNITQHSKLRVNHLGTCIGFETRKVPYDDKYRLKTLELFEDKSKDLHGFALNGYAGEVLPFLSFKENNGSFTPSSRDGMLWNIASQLMNFKMDLNASKATLKRPFNFETTIQQIYTFARREADIVLYPIYQFDIIVFEIDRSIAYKDSGVCIISHRAGFETALFDAKLLQENWELVIEFLFLFSFVWLLFFIFNVTEKGVPSLDQAGKDFVNAVRSVMSITVFRPPKWKSFRIFLFVSIWAFFLINFATQAAIISFFSAYKRGKDVDTFEDMIEKGYSIEGMSSPDMMLPDTEERFRKINTKLVPILNLYQCVDRLLNDSHRFCLLDCSVGYYLARNRLNEKGEQYLHIAKDRIHAHYLNLIFYRYCPLTERINSYLRIFIEAGLILKWEQYRYNDVKPEVPVKALSLEDLIGIFKCYYLLLGLSSVSFLGEVLVVMLYRFRRYISKKLFHWKRSRIAKKKLLEEKKRGIIQQVNTFTQTSSLILACVL